MRSDKGPWNDSDILKVCIYYQFPSFVLELVHFSSYKYHELISFVNQMVQNGEGKCTRRSLSDIEEKTISEDDKVLVISSSFAFFISQISFVKFA